MTTMDTGAIEAEVIAAFDGLVEACRALDAGRYLAYIDQEKFSGLSAEGKVWHAFEDLESLVSGGFRMIDRIVSLEFSKVKVTAIHPSTAVLVNEFRQTIRLKNADLVEQAGGGTQVWSKSGDAWKLVSISASDAKETAKAVF